MNNYIIGGVRAFSFNMYLAAMKVKYDLFELFIKENKIHWEMDPNKELIQESWDDIAPLTVQQAFEEKNQEKRRVLFSCIGPSKLFQSLKPKLIDRTVLEIKNKTWDADGKENIVDIKDVYELYEISESELFRGTEGGNSFLRSRVSPMLRVVRCWCTTTGREYWIFVEDQVAMGRTIYQALPNGKYEYKKPMQNAIEAIAWTFRVGIPKEDISELYRQGDCLVIKTKKHATALPQDKWYHLDEETYRKKLVAQS